MLFVDIKNTKVPALGFGTWQLSGDTCYDAVKNALNVGYRHIDTAQIYENEAEVGLALTDSGVKRSDIFLTTKLWTSNLTSRKVATSVEDSLKKLKTDYVDLLLIHWYNAEVPLAETLSAMEALVQQGKTRFIGVSNFPVAAMQEAVEQCKADIVCNQVEYHPLLSQQKVIDYARQHSIVVTAYSPIARGKLHDNALLAAIGKKYHKTPSQVALRWLLQQPGVMAIPKAAQLEHIKSNLALFDFELVQEDCNAITNAQGSTRLINPSFAPQWD